MRNPEGIENNNDIDALLRMESENLSVKRKDIEHLLEKYDGMENLLSAITRKGYLLHGSNLQIKEFEPRVPKKVEDRPSVPENEQEAVYASKGPVLPICMAIVSRDLMREASHQNIQNGGKVVSFGVGGKEDDSNEVQFYASESLEPFLKPGYVHVLKPDQFIPSDPDDLEGSQYVSYESVRPILILPILPSDFTHEVEVRG